MNFGKSVTIEGFEDVDKSKPLFGSVVTRSWAEFEERCDRLREWFPEAWFYFSTVVGGRKIYISTSRDVKFFFEGRSVP